MIALLAMPDDPVAIPEWLDGALLGSDLPQLVAELRAVHRPGPTPQLDAVLGDDRETFLTGGFSALRPNVRRSLLRNPDLLPELAELVFAEGGDHWLGGPLDPLEQARAAKVAANVHAARLAETRKPARRWFERAGFGLAIAATVLLAVTVSNGRKDNPPVASAGRGFNKINELPRDSDAKTVFTKMADLADEFDSKPTDDRLALATRLTEFRLGCSALQDAKLPLSATESEWVKLRCQDWAAEIDKHLRDLDRTGDVPAVRTAAAATATAIARELRERARA